MVFHKFIHSHKKGKHRTTADNFCLFLLDLMPLLPKNELIILNNALIHHTNKIHATLKLLKNQGICHLFLPPYSPFMNPI